MRAPRIRLSIAQMAGKDEHNRLPGVWRLSVRYRSAGQRVLDIFSSFVSAIGRFPRLLGRFEHDFGRFRRFFWFRSARSRGEHNQACSRHAEPAQDHRLSCIGIGWLFFLTSPEQKCQTTGENKQAETGANE